jgi:hypothetical protein
MRVGPEDLLDAGGPTTTPRRFSKPLWPIGCHRLNFNVIAIHK